MNTIIIAPIGDNLSALFAGLDEFRPARMILLAPTILRITLGPLFFIPGIMKLMNPDMIIGMLGGLGFPTPTLFGWVLILSEIVFGASVLVGWKLKYTVWPLVVILAVAAVTVYLPKLGSDPMALISILFHSTGIAGLVSLYLSGAGAMAVSEE